MMVKLHNQQSYAQSAVPDTNTYAHQLSNEVPPNLNANLVFPQLF